MVYDVVIVGSGVAGSLLAYKLSKAGKSVLIVEAGIRGESRSEMVHRFTEASLKIPSSPYQDGTSYMQVPAPKVVQDDYYDQAGPNKFKSTYLRRAGGSTWHWLGNVPRFVPNDFKIKSIYGVGFDWPINYDEMEPWYCEAEKELGVSGNHKEWNGLHGGGRSERFPMKNIPISYSDKTIKKKLVNFIFEGEQVKINSTPQARNSEMYDGRPPCFGSSSCIPICPLGAKYDASVHLAKAESQGAKVVFGHVVTKVESTESGDSVKGIRYKTLDGDEDIFKAKKYVIAAHAIETPKLLLLSGIANGSDQVGRNLMDHLNGAGAAILDEKVFSFRGPLTTSGIDTFRDGGARTESAAFRLSLGNNGWGRIESLNSLVTELVENKSFFGKELKQKFIERATKMFRISFSTEMLPESHNRVTLSDQLDSLGVPKPKIEFKVSDYNYEGFKRARRLINEAFDKLNVSERKFNGDEFSYSGAGHIMGTCRMGHDPSLSVVDENCKAHELDNLYIAGSSVFPSSGTANPTLTIAALSARLGSHLIEELNTQ